MKLIGASAAWVGDVVAWLTDTRYAWESPQMMWLAPKGPLTTVIVVWTSPAESEVIDLTSVGAFSRRMRVPQLRMAR
ncbi:MAG: hypothetical protein ACRDYY_14750 [Acidimicrobiales bacterium]